MSVSDISLQIQVPKIPGQDTSQFQEWHWKDANKRKAIHIRCNVEEVGTVQTLLEVAKEKDGRSSVGQEREGQQSCSYTRQEEERSGGRGG